VTGSGRLEGYDRLDNEIHAGLRLHAVADWGSYPPEFARLYEYEATSADPYALFEPYRGEPLRTVGEYLFAAEYDQFVTGLLAGLCWLAGAGIAHRAISPDTVLWDSATGKVQITGFSLSAPFGGARTPIASSRERVPRESRPDTCYGTFGPTDDLWAAARLLYYVRSRGEDLDDPIKLTESGLTQMFNGLIEQVFSPPESRPTARDLIEYGLRRPHLVPSLADRSERAIQGRASFLDARARKHPGVPLPPGFWNDITWPGAGRAAGGPQGDGG
jgi:serine/threonine protein kinase